MQKYVFPNLPPGIITVTPTLSSILAVDVGLLVWFLGSRALEFCRLLSIG